ncbi:MAG: hypothetical protein ACLFVZ_06355, partial [Actinomycetota bacterium]
SPDCVTTFSGSCDPGAIRQESGTAGPYTITISQPVPDGHDLMGSQTPNPDVDGSPCQRLAVTIQKFRPHTFARVLGFDSDTTTVNSVARKTPDAGDSEVVPLLVLEPIACEAVYTSGQGKVTVSYDLATKTPGFIVVDSDASACSSSESYSIDSMGNQNGWIRAIPVPDSNVCSPTPGILVPSAILSFALADIGVADPNASYDPNDRTNSVDEADISDPCEPMESRYRLYPTPRPVSQRITRAPIDWRYNCTTGYDDYLLDTSNPGMGGIKIHDCPKAGTLTPYIDTLESTYQSGTTLVGFKTWTNEGYSCNVGSDITGLSGNWYVDCPSDLIVNGATVTFEGSNIVFEGGVDLRSNAVMELNKDDGDNYFVYVRDGTMLKRAQAALVLDQTFVYLANGKIDLRAGDGGLTWIAPEGTTTDPVGTKYDFDDLALWSEANLTHEIGGQAGNSLTGTFFTPYAEPFSLTGQGGQFQLEAQFITRRLELKGQGEVRMHPNPTKTTPIPISAVLLIR